MPQEWDNHAGTVTKEDELRRSWRTARWKTKRKVLVPGNKEGADPNVSESVRRNYGKFLESLPEGNRN
jgi:hypothetical protein